MLYTGRSPVYSENGFNTNSPAIDWHGTGAAPNSYHLFISTKVCHLSNLVPIGFQSRAIPWTNPELHGGRNSCRSMQTPSNTGPMHGNPEQFQCQSLTYSMPIFLSPQIKQSNPSQSMPIRVPVHAIHGRSSANPSQHFQATNDHPIFQSWPIHTNSGESSAIPRPFSRPFVPIT